MSISERVTRRADVITHGILSSWLLLLSIILARPLGANRWCMRCIGIHAAPSQLVHQFRVSQLAVAVHQLGGHIRDRNPRQSGGLTSQGESLVPTIKHMLAFAQTCSQG